MEITRETKLSDLIAQYPWLKGVICVLAGRDCSCTGGGMGIAGSLVSTGVFSSDALVSSTGWGAAGAFSFFFEGLMATMKSTCARRTQAKMINNCVCFMVQTPSGYGSLLNTLLLQPLAMVMSLKSSYARG